MEISRTQSASNAQLHQVILEPDHQKSSVPTRTQTKQDFPTLARSHNIPLPAIPRQNNASQSTANTSADFNKILPYPKNIGLNSQPPSLKAASAEVLKNRHGLTQKNDTPASPSDLEEHVYDTPRSLTQKNSTPATPSDLEEHVYDTPRSLTQKNGIPATPSDLEENIYETPRSLDQKNSTPASPSDLEEHVYDTPRSLTQKNGKPASPSDLEQHYDILRPRVSFAIPSKSHGTKTDTDFRLSRPLPSPPKLNTESQERSKKITTLNEKNSSSTITDTLSQVTNDDEENPYSTIGETLSPTINLDEKNPYATIGETLSPTINLDEENPSSTVVKNPTLHTLDRRSTTVTTEKVTIPEEAEEEIYDTINESFLSEKDQPLTTDHVALDRESSIRPQHRHHPLSDKQNITLRFGKLQQHNECSRILKQKIPTHPSTEYKAYTQQLLSLARTIQFDDVLCAKFLTEDNIATINQAMRTQQELPRQTLKNIKKIVQTAVNAIQKDITDHLLSTIDRPKNKQAKAIEKIFLKTIKNDISFSIRAGLSNAIAEQIYKKTGLDARSSSQSALSAQEKSGTIHVMTANELNNIGVKFLTQSALPSNPLKIHISVTPIFSKFSKHNSRVFSFTAIKPIVKNINTLNNKVKIADQLISRYSNNNDPSPKIKKHLLQVQAKRKKLVEKEIPQQQQKLDKAITSLAKTVSRETLKVIQPTQSKKFVSLLLKKDGYISKNQNPIVQNRRNRAAQSLLQVVKISVYNTYLAAQQDSVLRISSPLPSSVEKR